MIRIKESGAKILCLLLMLAGLVSCRWVKDDIDSCPTGIILHIQAAATVETGGPSKVEAFLQETDEVSLWFFDEHGLFVKSFVIPEKELLDNDYTKTLDLDAGSYQLVAWMPDDKANYDIPALNPGVSHIDELLLTIKRNEAVINTELTPLWHGYKADILVKPRVVSRQELYMTKVTNSLVFVLQDVSGMQLDDKKFGFTLTAENGKMDYRKALLQDETLTYKPYSKETVVLSDKSQAVKAQMHIGRIMADRSMNLKITDLEKNDEIVDINLTEYLLLTRENFESSRRVKLTPQQYLDYEDHYAVVFYFVADASKFILAKITVNGWIVRRNDAELD